MGYVYLNCSVPGRIVIHSLFSGPIDLYLARVETWRVLRVQRCTANNAGGASGTTLCEIILGQECIGIHFC